MYLAENHQDKHILFDPASNEMAEKAKDIISGFHIVKPNQEEMEILSGASIETFEEAKKAGEILRDEGNRQIIITLEDGGAVYNDEMEWKLLEAPTIDPVSATGAGDAFNAALLYGFYHQFELEDSVKFAVAASTLTLQAKEAVHPDMSVNQVKRMMAEINE